MKQRFSADTRGVYWGKQKMDIGSNDPRVRHGVHRRYRRQCRSSCNADRPSRHGHRHAMGGGSLWAVARSFVDWWADRWAIDTDEERYLSMRAFLFAVDPPRPCCGFAPSISLLVLARGAQGVGAALLVPGSLAIISASFPAAERGRAIRHLVGLHSGHSGNRACRLAAGWLTMHRGAGFSS